MPLIGFIFYRVYLFLFELLAAEFIFFNVFKKKKKYYLKLIISLIAIILIASLFAYITCEVLKLINFDYTDIRMGIIQTMPNIVLILLSGILYFSLYHVDLNECAFAVISGYAVRHLIFSIYLLIINLFLIDYNILAFNNISIVGIVLYLIIYTVLYLLIYFIFGKKVTPDRDYDFGKATIIIYSIIIFFNVCINAISELYSQEQIFLYIGGLLLQIFSMILVLFVEVLLLNSQQLKNENKIIDTILNEEKKQYKFAKSNAEQIGIQAHDLKHKVGILRKGGEEAEKLLNELEKTVTSYDVIVKTDNAPINVIISEKWMYCSEHNIKFTCMVDPEALNFIDDIDIYSLIGNIVDNCIEAVMKLDDINKRVITINIFKKKGMSFISTSNYYQGYLQIENGQLITSKKDKANHGFGIKSIYKIVEKYHGNINIDGENQVFHLNITFNK